MTTKTEAPSEQETPPVVQAAPVSTALPVDEETAAQLQQWTDARNLLIGTLLKQFGRRAATISQSELRKFHKENEVQFTPMGDGLLRYEIIKRKKEG